MKSKVEVEREWRNWVNEISLREAMTLTRRLNLMDDIAKEMRWFIYCQSPERDLPLRVKKYGILQSCSTMKIEDFEPNWKYKMDFFNWVLAS